MFRRTSECRACNADNLKPIVSFGKTAIADRLLCSEQEFDGEPLIPLDLLFCDRCALAQIGISVDPKVLFQCDYPYYSSISPALGAHFQASAEDIMRGRDLGPSSLVVEAGSNDGYLLRHFAARHIPVLGVDPAEGPVRAAMDLGIETRLDFFGESLAADLAEERGRADIFLANNVLAHAADLRGFIRGIKTLLKDDGVAIIEVPYVVDLIDQCEFDTIYHQHLCYFSVTALDNLFASLGLHINDASRVSVHGGSLRLFVEKSAKPRPTVENLLTMEADRSVDRYEFFRDFGKRCETVRKHLIDLIGDLRAKGMSIAAYGAAAKAVTLLAYSGLGTDDLLYVVDRNRRKHGKFLPGSHLPIRPVEALAASAPDYLLILAWNFAEEIIDQQSEFKKLGGQFIVPIPWPRIV